MSTYPNKVLNSKTEIEPNNMSDPSEKMSIPQRIMGLIFHSMDKNSIPGWSHF